MSFNVLDKEVTDEYRTRLQEIYNTHITQLLAKCKGKEHEMYTKICQEYGVDPKEKYTPGEKAAANPALRINGMTLRDMQLKHNRDMKKLATTLTGNHIRHVKKVERQAQTAIRHVTRAVGKTRDILHRRQNVVTEMEQIRLKAIREPGRTSAQDQKRLEGLSEKLAKLDAELRCRKTHVPQSHEVVSMMQKVTDMRVALEYTRAMLNDTLEQIGSGYAEISAACEKYRGACQIDVKKWREKYNLQMGIRREALKGNLSSEGGLRVFVRVRPYMPWDGDDRTPLLSYPVDNPDQPIEQVHCVNKDGQQEEFDFDRSSPRRSRGTMCY